MIFYYSIYLKLNKCDNMVSALIPVSPLESAKSRLKNFLTSEERKNLIKNMLLDVYYGIKDLCDNVYIVSRDREILSFSKELNMIQIYEDGSNGLNGALYDAINRIKENSVMIVPADVPLIRRVNLREITNKLKDTKESVIICPSRGGGTNLLILKPKNIIKPSYEGFSFMKHVEQCNKNNLNMSIFSSFYLSIDINTVEDLGEVLIHGKDTYTYKYLKELGISAFPKHSSAGRFEITRDK